MTTDLSLDTWEHPGTWVRATASSPGATGCERLAFEPAIEVRPDTAQPDAASGGGWSHGSAGRAQGRRRSGGGPSEDRDGGPSRGGCRSIRPLPMVCGRVTTRRWVWHAIARWPVPTPRRSVPRRPRPRCSPTASRALSTSVLRHRVTQSRVTCSGSRWSWRISTGACQSGCRDQSPPTGTRGGSSRRSQTTRSSRYPMSSSSSRAGLARHWPRRRRVARRRSRASSPPGRPRRSAAHRRRRWSVLPGSAGSRRRWTPGS